MAPRKPQPTADDAKPAASGARITKTRTARGTNTNTNINVNPTTLSTASSATHHIKGYKNGILNLEKTPSHLVSMYGGYVGVQCLQAIANPTAAYSETIPIHLFFAFLPRSEFAFGTSLCAVARWFSSRTT
jgi:hypothetical protein